MTHESKASRKYRKDAYENKVAKTRHVNKYRDEEFEEHLESVAAEGVSERAAREMPWYRVDETRPHMPPLKIKDEVKE